MSDVGGRWAEVGQRLEALESAGNAVKDDAVKSDVRETGRLLLDAMSASLAKASENLRDKSAAPAPSTAAAPETPETPAESKPITSE